MLLLTQPITAENLMFSSNNQATTFLELYTSQGCNSCPPAERWLSELTEAPQLWTSIIPINFHVDYWDYLGWKDPFALADFSQRQRRYNALGLTNQVATPGFIVNGRGWNGWFSKSQLPEKIRLSSIKLTATLTENNLNINIDSHKAQDLIVNIAILGFGIQTPVKRGENKGKTLNHDFVVIGYKHNNVKLQPQNIDDPSSTEDIDKGHNLTTQLPNIFDNQNIGNRRALVIWLSAKNNPSPLQVAAGWL